MVLDERIQLVDGILTVLLRLGQLLGLLLLKFLLSTSNGLVYLRLQRSQILTGAFQREFIEIFLDRSQVFLHIC